MSQFDCDCDHALLRPALLTEWLLIIKAYERAHFGGKEIQPGRWHGLASYGCPVLPAWLTRTFLYWLHESHPLTLMNLH